MEDTGRADDRHVSHERAGLRSGEPPPAFDWGRPGPIYPGFPRCLRGECPASAVRYVYGAYPLSGTYAEKRSGPAIGKDFGADVLPQDTC